MTCVCCSIIPNDVLRRFAEDPDLPDAVREAFEKAALVDNALRNLRDQALTLTSLTSTLMPAGLTLAAAPAITVYDCNHSQTLPGAHVSGAGTSADISAKRAFDETQAVADFYRQVFNRNSIDGAGMTMVSSIHFGVDYNNAQWNGAQMLYGDGDGQIFIDFTGGNDVIGHELTHGVTQHSLQLVYANESGGLNESLSDVFGSMFRQWQAGQTVDTADWLIGSTIMGPAAIAKGYTCLRDMADPAAAHCLSAQPTHFSDYQPGMDPHFSSGIPNLAFHTAAMAIGGRSWEKAGQIWYRAMTGYGPSPNMTMAQFADQTRNAAAQLYPGDAATAAAVDQGWQQVGL
jgi:Zn-dependent metalloprotease